MTAETVTSPTVMRARPAVPTVEPSRADRGQRAPSTVSASASAASSPACARIGKRKGVLEGASRALRGLAVQHDQREDRAAERDRVADEPGRSQPQEHERDHDSPQ